MAGPLEKLLGPGPVPEKIASGYGATDGPLFSRLGYLLFTDVPAARILRWEAGKVAVFRENANGARGLTFDHQGRLLACERNRLTRTEKDGAVTVLAPVEGGPGDVVYAIDGSIYFTGAAVWQVTRDGTVRVAARDCERPTGVALAPDQQKLYVSDAARHNVRVYEIEPDGALRPGRVFAEKLPSPAGLKTDEQGNLWVAGGDAVTVLDSRGALIGALAFPEPVRNCNWGDAFRSLYTAAGGSVYRIPAKVNGTRTY
jgi:gluconolactonase